MFIFSCLFLNGRSTFSTKGASLRRLSKAKSVSRVLAWPFMAERLPAAESNFKELTTTPFGTSRDKAIVNSAQGTEFFWIDLAAAIFFFIFFFFCLVFRVFLGG